MKSRKILVVKQSDSYTDWAGLSATPLGHEAPLYSTYKGSRLFNSLPREPSASSSTNGNAYNPSAGVSPPFALIIVLSLSIFFFVGSLSICVRICGGQGDTEENSRHAGNERRNRASQGLDKSKIETFPVFTYPLVKGLKQGNQAQECAVCLSEYEDDERLRLLPKCGHAFHLDCIDMWLFSHTTCPLCRYSLVLDSEVEEQGSGVNVEDHLQEGALQAAEQVAVIVVGAENTVEERVGHQSRGRNEMNPFDAGLDLTSPGQARIYNGCKVSPTDSPILGIMSGLRPLEKGNKIFRRSHSTGHSLVRVGGNPEHPCAFYISTDDRYVSNFTEEEAMESSKAVLHKCSSFASFCYPRSSSPLEVTLNHQALKTL